VVDTYPWSICGVSDTGYVVTWKYRGNIDSNSPTLTQKKVNEIKLLYWPEQNFAAVLSATEGKQKRYCRPCHLAAVVFFSAWYIERAIKFDVYEETETINMDGI
jgi:hypothetical protein